MSLTAKIFRKLNGNLKLVCNSEESIDCYYQLTGIFNYAALKRKMTRMTRATKTSMAILPLDD